MKFSFEDRYLVIKECTESEKEEIRKLLTWQDQSFTETDDKNLKRLRNLEILSDSDNAFLRSLEKKYRESLSYLYKERDDYISTFHFLSNKLKDLFPNVIIEGEINLPLGERIEVEKDILNGIELFDFQKDAVEKCLYRKFGNVVIPTGGGKTFCILALLEKLDQLGKLDKALIIVPTVVIGEQFINYALNVGFNKKDIKKLSGGFKDFDAKVLVAVVNTISEGIKSKDENIMQLLDDVNVIIMDECHHCLSPDSKIYTDRGILTIKNIVENKIKCKVLSYNEKKEKYEYKNILNYFSFEIDKEQDLIEIEYDFKGSVRKIKCTSEHKIYTSNRGYVKAEDLKELDDVFINDVFVCSQCGEYFSDRILLANHINAKHSKDNHKASRKNVWKAIESPNRNNENARRLNSESKNSKGIYK